MYGRCQSDINAELPRTDLRSQCIFTKDLQLLPDAGRRGAAHRPNRSEREAKARYGFSSGRILADCPSRFDLASVQFLMVSIDKLRSTLVPNRNSRWGRGLGASRPRSLFDHFCAVVIQVPSDACNESFATLFGRGE